MRDINTLTLIGRLVADQQISYTNSGLAIGNFTIAVNESIKQNNQWTDRVNFFDIVLIGKLSEALGPHMTKGKMVAVDGRLRQERWTAQDGSKRQRVKVIADNIQLVGASPNSQAQGAFSPPGGYNPVGGGNQQGGFHGNKSASQKPVPPPNQPDNNVFDDFEDDIPF